MIKDKGIRQLQLLVWLFLASSFGVILFFAFFISYDSTANHLEREWQHWLNSPDFAEGIREGTGKEAGFFTVRLDSETETAAIYSGLDLPDGDYQALLSQVLDRNWDLEAGSIHWRDAFAQALHLESPFLAQGQRHWAYTFIEDLELLEVVNDQLLDLGNLPPNVELAFDLNNDAYVMSRTAADLPLVFHRIFELSPISLLVFVDVTDAAMELANLRQVLFQVGTGSMLVAALVTYVISLLLVRPIGKAFKLQKQFVADASHELKTPLNIIRTNFEALKTNKKETIESQMEWLDYMEFGFDRMANLTRDLLELAQLDNPSLKFERKIFNFSLMAHQLLPYFQAETQRKDLTVTCEIQPNLLMRGDEEKLLQALVALMDNAVKYSDFSGWVKISVVRVRKKIVFSIQNSGPGIGPDKLPHIFERFHQGSDSRKAGENSYGLGLAIVQAIVKKSGGKITAASIPQEATTMTVIFNIQRI